MIDRQTGEILERETPFLRTPYNYDMNRVSDETSLYTPEKTRAQQQFKEETDINTIVERFGLTGELPTALVVPQSADFSNAMTYQEALNAIRAAEEAFMEMPAHIRAEFGNDAGKFVSFVEDPKNKEKAKEWGLLKAPEPLARPIEVRVIPEATEAPIQAPQVTPKGVT